MTLKSTPFSQQTSPMILNSSCHVRLFSTVAFPLGFLFKSAAKNNHWETLSTNDVLVSRLVVKYNTLLQTEPNQPMTSSKTFRFLGTFFILKLLTDFWHLHCFFFPRSQLNLCPHNNSVWQKKTQIKNWPFRWMIESTKKKKTVGWLNQQDKKMPMHTKQLFSPYRNRPLHV